MKRLAKEPIQLDVVLVCRKRASDHRSAELGPTALARAFDKAVAKASRLRCKGFDLSRNDRRVILYSQFLSELGPTDKAEDALQPLLEQQSKLDAALDEPVFCNPITLQSEAIRDSSPQFVQRLLFD